MAAPSVFHQLKSYSYERAFELAKEQRRKNNVNFVEKARIAAIRFHDASKDNSAVIKVIMDSKHKNKKEHTKNLIRNPSVNLSAHHNYLAKKLLGDQNTESMKLLVNNSRIDLSFDNNYLLEEAQKRGNHGMIQLLQYDSNIRNQINSGHQNVNLTPKQIDINYTDDDQDLISKGATILSSVNPEQEQISVDITDLSLDNDYPSISESLDDQELDADIVDQKTSDDLKTRDRLKDELGWVDINFPFDDDWINLGNPEDVSLL
jgi:hypothetical protein